MQNNIWVNKPKRISNIDPKLISDGIIMSGKTISYYLGWTTHHLTDKGYNAFMALRKRWIPISTRICEYFVESNFGKLKKDYQLDISVNSATTELTDEVKAQIALMMD